MDSAVLRSLLIEVASLSLEHIVLVAVSSSIAILIGVGIGIIGTRRAHIRRVSITVANILQTIPSLALFGFLLPI
ncbi:MAG: ABC transporter permease, partial [Acidobacteriaceae bacterium]|nr:ABC transporter permease [Acidobacteriaceae bacterium]